MTFLAPGYLFAGLAVAAVIGVLHFIVRRLPRAALLPTARFVPDTPATTIALAKRPSDIPVMLLRMLTVLAAGAGLARPLLTPSRGPIARVILADVSRSAGDASGVRDSVLAVYRDGDAVVLFDSAARVVVSGVRDSILSLSPSRRRGNLSAGLIAALRAGSMLRGRADSLQLVIVSPFAREELDAATVAIRKLWPGTARLVRVPVKPGDTIPPTRGLTITTAGEDPLAITAAIARPAVAGNSVIDRTGVGAPVSDGAVLWWPATTRSRFAVPRAKKDTVGGVTEGDENVIAQFERLWMYPEDSLRGAGVIARWVDGEPAAIEKPDGNACARSVAIPVTPVGDLPIRHEFVHLVTALARPCAWRTALAPADPSTVSRLEGTGGLVPRSAFQPMTNVRSALAPFLLGLALSSALVELLVRRRSSSIASAPQRRKPAAREPRAA